MSSFSHVVAVGPWMALLNTDRAESARDWGFNTVNRQSIKLDSSPCNGYLIRNELMEAAAVPSKCPLFSCALPDFPSGLISLSSLTIKMEQL